MMPESEVLSRIGLGGMEETVEAVAELLVSIGYHDTATTLRARWDDEPRYREDNW